MHEFLRKVGIGFLSGTIGSIFNIPIDVAKSRIQVSCVTKSTKAKSYTKLYHGIDISITNWNSIMKLL